MPVLNSLHMKYKHQGLVVIGINDIDDKLPEIRSYIKEKDYQYHQLINTGVNKRYAINTFPTTILIDKKGIIKNIDISYIGFEDSMTKLIEAELNK